MNNFKVGDKVILEKYGAVGPETGDWAKQDKLPLNTELEITSVRHDNYVELKGYYYGHHYSKFKLAPSSIPRICYKSDGTKETGRKIIKALEDLGGKNDNCVSGEGLDLYYYNFNNVILATATFPKGYTEAFLEADKSPYKPGVWVVRNKTLVNDGEYNKGDRAKIVSVEKTPDKVSYFKLYKKHEPNSLCNGTPGNWDIDPNQSDDVSIKPLTKEDMIEGEAYMIKRSGNLYIVNTRKDYICVNNTPLFEEGFMFASWDIIEVASQENKKWLEACIKAGKWMSKEEALQKPMFKKGEYIVLIDVLTDDSYKHNHCYKQSVDYHYFMSCLDSKGRTTNGWSFINHDVPSRWRYATSEEAAYYERIGKPYNVVTEIYTPIFYGRIEEDGQVNTSSRTGILPVDHSKESIPEYVECILEWYGDKPSVFGKIYKTSIVPDFSEISWKDLLDNNRSDWFKPSTKEAYDAQFKSSMESNLEKAKRLYPLGTNFIAIVSKVLNVSLGIFTIENNGNITVNIEEGGRHTVYQEGYDRWAEIVKEAPKEEEWQVGGRVEIINNPYSYNTYKLGGIHQITKVDGNIIRLDNPSGVDLDFHKKECKWLGMNRPFGVTWQQETPGLVGVSPKKKGFDETAYNASSFNQELKLNIKKPINKKITI